MHTHEIQYILDHGTWIKNLHAQVCAKDQLPKQKPVSVQAYIVNTDSSDRSGEHWIAVIFNRNGESTYFDSYGLPPLDTEIMSFIHNNSSSWTYNKQVIQSLLGVVCGYYCIFVLNAVARGNNLQKCLQQTFRTTEHHRNDRNVTIWFKQIYGKTIHEKTLKTLL